MATLQLAGGWHQRVPGDGVTVVGPDGYRDVPKDKEGLTNYLGSFLPPAGDVHSMEGARRVRDVSIPPPRRQRPYHFAPISCLKLQTAALQTLCSTLHFILKDEI